MIAHINPEQIAGIGMSNQRETTILWDRATGQPIHHAIVWQDRRTAEQCEQLKAHEALIARKTGLVIDPYFSATKIAWLLEHVDGARQKAERGALAFGTIDTWLLWQLTGGKTHATDATNASRTMLFNINHQQWDDELLTLFAIPRALLPEVKDSNAHFGVCDHAHFNYPIPITGIAGDQLKLIKKASETQALAESIEHTGGVYCVPAFTGLGAPYWDPDARGALVCLTRSSGVAEIVRATLESVCYQTRDLMDAMLKDYSGELATLRVDGGMVANDWLLQFLSDILHLPVQRPHCIETSALGAAYLAGLGAGVFDSLDDIQHHWQLEREFSPSMSDNQRDALYRGWQDAVKRVR